MSPGSQTRARVTVVHVPESPAGITDTPPVVELDRVEMWRAEELERAGFPRDDALLLAVHHEVDLHTAVELIVAGCDATTALRILL